MFVDPSGQRGHVSLQCVARGSQLRDLGPDGAFGFLGHPGDRPLSVGDELACLGLAVAQQLRGLLTRLLDGRIRGPLGQNERAPERVVRPRRFGSRPLGTDGAFRRGAEAFLQDLDPLGYPLEELVDILRVIAAEFLAELNFSDRFRRDVHVRILPLPSLRHADPGGMGQKNPPAPQIAPCTTSMMMKTTRKERSMNPVLGMSWRTGARTGSVSEYTTLRTEFQPEDPETGIQLKTARTMSTIK